jgi:polyisoprenoid-binding protein YceI
MIKNISKFLSVLFLLFTLTISAQTEMKTNTKNSTINWKGFKPTGSHFGSIMLKNGNFTLEGNQIIGGEFTIDMTTIVDLDMPADNEYNAKLVKHLKSEDFFGVEKHPTANFKITKVENKGDKTLVSGDLTIKNKTNPISFLASTVFSNNVLLLKSDTFKIDRSKWNIKYKSKSFFDDLADKFIYDEIEISIEIEAGK